VGPRFVDWIMALVRLGRLDPLSDGGTTWAISTPLQVEDLGSIGSGTVCGSSTTPVEDWKQIKQPEARNV